MLGDFWVIEYVCFVQKLSLNLGFVLNLVYFVVWLVLRFVFGRTECVV